MTDEDDGQESFLTWAEELDGSLEAVRWEFDDRRGKYIWRRYSRLRGFWSQRQWARFLRLWGWDKDEIEAAICDPTSDQALTARALLREGLPSHARSAREARRRPSRRHEEWAEVSALYQRHGLEVAVERTGWSARTIQRWAKAKGVTPRRSVRRRRARQATNKRRAGLVKAREVRRRAVPKAQQLQRGLFTEDMLRERGVPESVLELRRMPHSRRRSELEHRRGAKT